MSYRELAIARGIHNQSFGAQNQIFPFFLCYCWNLTLIYDPKLKSMVMNLKTIIKSIKHHIAIATSALLLLSSSGSWAACDDDYNVSHHHVSGKIDICTLQEEMGSRYQVLINWGTKPEWLNDTQFVFINNLVGDVYQMDLDTNEVSSITSHFLHSGFTRAHTLPSGDLLLLGPSSGEQPPMDSLIMYDEGQFTGDLWIFEAPFDGSPYPLQREVTSGFLWWQKTKMVNVQAWEGIAVSQESNKIVWSDTRVPFYGANIIETGVNYFTKKSNLWLGEIVYNTEGIAVLQNAEEIVSKAEIGGVFLEPQNFKGLQDEQVLFEAYGPSSEGSSDTYIYDMQEDKIIRQFTAKAYDEWEGIAPDYSKAFVEVDEAATRFTGPVKVKLHMYDFSTSTLTPFIEFSEPAINEYFYVHEPVFSPDGTRVLMTTGATVGNEFNGPGYGIGMVLVDLE